MKNSLLLLILVITAQSAGNVYAQADMKTKATVLDKIQKMMDGRDPLEETLKKATYQQDEMLAANAGMDKETFHIIRSLKNPFVPQLPVEPKIEAQQTAQSTRDDPLRVAPVQQVQQVVPPPEFHVSGVVWNTDRPEAIINGQVFTVGEKVENWEIISISADGVKLTFNTQTVNAKTESPGTKTRDLQRSQNLRPSTVIPGR